MKFITKPNFYSLTEVKDLCSKFLGDTPFPKFLSELQVDVTFGVPLGTNHDGYWIFFQEIPKDVAIATWSLPNVSVSKTGMSTLLYYAIKHFHEKRSRSIY